MINRFRSDIQIEQKEHSGIVVMDDETTESFYLLMSCASIKNLIKYTNDSNAFIRSSMLIGLVRKNANKNTLLRILDNHRNDTAKYTIKSADVVTEWTVRGSMQLAMNFKDSNKLGNINYKKILEKIRSKVEIKLKIDGIHHGLIDKKDLLKIDSLSLTYNNFRVQSFTLFMAGRVMSSTDNILTSEMRLSLEKAEAGDVLFFDNIRVTGEDNTTRLLAPLLLKIK